MIFCTTILVLPAYSLIIFIPFQVFLDHRPRDEVRQLVSARTNGATPLVLSCRNGHKDVVEYLVERCNADVEQAGIKNNCQFAMDHHKNKTFKNIISWWQLSVFWDFARLLKPIYIINPQPESVCPLTRVAPEPLDLWSWNFACVIYWSYGRFLRKKFRKINKWTSFLDQYSMDLL